MMIIQTGRAWRWWKYVALALLLLVFGLGAGAAFLTMHLQVRPPKTPQRPS